MIRSSLSPVPRVTLTHEVTERVRRAILAGELTGGQSLTESALAARLGVSRVPVREALVELEREGLVVFNDRGRAAVREFTADDFAEIAGLRTTLQVMSAKLAAVRHTAEDLAALEDIVRRADETSDPTEFSRLDSAFHDEIVRVARHQRLAQCWNNLRAQMELWIARAHRGTHDVHARTIRAHTAMIDTLRARQPAEAGRLMETHCDSLHRQPA